MAGTRACTEKGSQRPAMAARDLSAIGGWRQQPLEGLFSVVEDLNAVDPKDVNEHGGAPLISIRRADRYPPQVALAQARDYAGREGCPHRNGCRCKYECDTSDRA